MQSTGSPGDQIAVVGAVSANASTSDRYTTS
jgi:hypothetical protein